MTKILSKAETRIIERANRAVVFAKKQETIAELRLSRTQGLINKMQIIRNANDAEIHLVNLPKWEINVGVIVPQDRRIDQIGYKGFTYEASDFSNRITSIIRYINSKHAEVYDTTGDGMVYYNHHLKKGHRKSEFSYNWYNPLGIWAAQFSNRTMKESTYRMIMDENPATVFDKIKTDNWKL
jgi:hypothetical protein